MVAVAKIRMVYSGWRSDWIEDVNRNLTPLALVTQLGATMAISIVIGVVVGLWVDRQLGTMPLFTLLLSLVGISAGSIYAYRLISESIVAAGATTSGRTRSRPRLADEEPGSVQEAEDRESEPSPPSPSEDDKRSHSTADDEEKA